MALSVSGRVSSGRTNPASAPSGTRETADLTLRLLEHLADQPGQCGVTEIARRFGLSKATVHRHLRTLARREFVRQDLVTQRYEPGIKLLKLGEQQRDRFGIAAAARSEMTRLRDESGQAVTVTAPVQGNALVLDLVQGHTVVDFGIRPGTSLPLHCSAHGKVMLAFGPAHLLRSCMSGVMTAMSPDTVTSPAVLAKQVAAVKKQGWATAANEVVFGVNALAAPVFDHHGEFAGSIAIVGSVQFIHAQPDAAQLDMVQSAARRVCMNLGWSGA